MVSLESRVRFSRVVSDKNWRSWSLGVPCCVAVVDLHSPLLEDILLVLPDTIALELLETASLAHPELAADSLDETLVVRNNDNSSLELLQCTRQSIDRIHIQVVGRLKKKKARAKKHASQLVPKRAETIPVTREHNLVKQIEEQNFTSSRIKK